MSTFRPDLLRRFRLAAGLSREQSGQHIGRGYFAVAAYEQGTTPPPLPILEKMADAYGVPVSAFFDQGDLERLVSDTRAAQGLPPTVTDPAVLAQIAAILVAAEKRGTGEVVPDAA